MCYRQDSKQNSFTQKLGQTIESITDLKLDVDNTLSWVVTPEDSYHFNVTIRGIMHFNDISIYTAYT